MNSKQLLNISFFIFFTAIFVGAIFKLQHWNYASTLLTIGLISLALFVITAIIEIMGSKKIDGAEKFMWTIGLLFFGAITGIVYLLSARNRIINNQ